MGRAAQLSLSGEPQTGVLIRLRGLYPSLKTALQRVAESILAQPKLGIYGSVSEVATTAGVSDATVVRFCRTLGFRGFQDFKIAMARDLVELEPRLPEEVGDRDCARTVVRKVFQANIDGLRDSLEVLDMEAMADAARGMLQARRLLIIGVGTSGPIVMGAGNRFIRLGIDVHCCTDVHLMMMGAALLTPQDVLLVISHSGSSRDLLETARLAAGAGARVICITNNSLSPLTRLSDLVLLTSYRETRFRHEAIASRLSQDSVIDSLYTLMALAHPQAAQDNLAKIENAIVSKHS